MYTSQKSIENKVGSVNGWKELLMSVGFRFEPAGNDYDDMSMMMMIMIMMLQLMGSLPPLLPAE